MNTIDFRSVDLNLLKVFEALYEEGGAGRAAIRLGLTQPAVSAALGRLRTLYANPLFERTGRGLRPTARAQELRPLIADALDRCRQSLALASPGADFSGRTLAIGLSDDYEIAFGFALIDHALARMPGLRLILRQTHSLLVGDMLLAREIDLSLTGGGVTSRVLGRQVLGTSRYACVIDTTSAPQGPLDLDDYLRRDHVLVSSGGYVGVVDEALVAIGRKRHVRASTTHFAALPHLLLGSTHVATLPQHAARALAAVTALRCIECPLNLPQYSLELGWRKDNVRDPAIQVLKDIITETISERLGRQSPPSIEGPVPGG